MLWRRQPLQITRLRVCHATAPLAVVLDPLSVVDGGVLEPLGLLPQHAAIELSVSACGAPVGGRSSRLSGTLRWVSAP